MTIITTLTTTCPRPTTHSHQIRFATAILIRENRRLQPKGKALSKLLNRVISTCNNQIRRTNRWDLLKINSTSKILKQPWISECSKSQKLIGSLLTSLRLQKLKRSQRKNKKHGNCINAPVVQMIKISQEKELEFA